MTEPSGDDSWTVPQEAAGQRLDAFLAQQDTRRSRSRWRALIDDDAVTVDGEPARPSARLHAGQRVLVDEPPPAPTSDIPQNIPLEVLFEDEHVIVINKAAGMVVHPAAGNADGTLVNALLFLVPGLRLGGVERPGIVHRLDKDTSGCIICAKNDEAHRRLSASFAARDVDKRYVAFCHGRMQKLQTELVTGHARHRGDRRRFTTRLDPPADANASSGVRRAHTRFHEVRYAGGVSELDVELFTGRTHQIRAHLSDAGHPLLEDGLYGGARSITRMPTGPVRDAVRRLTRQALHAAHLSLAHPFGGPDIDVDAPLPDDLERLRVAMRVATDGGDGRP